MAVMRLLMIDNYDSFTYNLVQYLQELGAAVEVVRNDAASIDELLARGPAGVVISPGPGRPEDGGVSVELVSACSERGIPLLGVCYGHQLIAHLAGAAVDWVEPGRAKVVGVEESRLSGGRLLPGEHCLRVVVSHREEVKKPPPGYRVTARRPSAEIDGLEHEQLPVFSFQFHPEAREEFARQAGIDVDRIDERLRVDSLRVLAAFLREVRFRRVGPA